MRKLNSSFSCLFTKNVLVIIFFVFDPILTKIGEIVVLMSTIKKSRTFVPFRLNVEE